MKQVVVKQPSPELISVENLVNPHLRAYVARTDKSLMLLIRDCDGYAFRYVDNLRLGHSGVWSTIQRTITEALELSGTEVFEFPNMLEAAKFIVTNA